MSVHKEPRNPCPNLEFLFSIGTILASIHQQRANVILLTRKSWHGPPWTEALPRSVACAEDKTPPSETVPSIELAAAASVLTPRPVRTADAEQVAAFRGLRHANVAGDGPLSLRRKAA